MLQANEHTTDNRGVGSSNLPRPIINLVKSIYVQSESGDLNMADERMAAEGRELLLKLPESGFESILPKPDEPTP